MSGLNKAYISSPLRGNEEENMFRARWYSRFAADEGVIPVTPHIYFTQFLRDHIPEERALAMRMNKVLLLECSEVWVFGSHISSGMRAEINWAKHKNYPIRYFSSQCKEVL